MDRLFGFFTAIAALSPAAPVQQCHHGFITRHFTTRASARRGVQESGCQQGFKALRAGVCEIHRMLALVERRECTGGFWQV